MDSKNDLPKTPAVSLWGTLWRDPRHYQITILGTLSLYGLGSLGFVVPPAQALTLIVTALVTQWAFSRWRGIALDVRSPLISSLSLCLLLRSPSMTLAALAAFVTIAGKFLIRRRGKHVFNPTNLGLVVMLGAALLLRAWWPSLGGVWVSPGQWGSTAFVGFFLACLGALVLYRAARADVSLGFLGAYAALCCGRALWLGDPWSIPLHQLQNGSLLIFTFFMISDPKTTPDSRAGRLLFAALVAVGAAWVQFGLYQPNGPLWALAALAPTVPLLDRLLPGQRYRWPGLPATTPSRLTLTGLTQNQGGQTMSSLSSPRCRLRRSALQGGVPRLFLALLLPLLLVSLLLPAGSASAFCGFYVAKADTKLFNRASKVVLVRDGDRTVMTMANDYQGDLSEFAVVIPVPTFLEREQIHVADNALIEHLDAYTAPRLVEYFDDNPCGRYEMEAAMPSAVMRQDMAAEGKSLERARSLGVTIEAQYDVGEYDILILSAEESTGLVTWLTESGYRLPEGAEPVVGSYLKQGVRFFVAKVDLSEQAKLGYSYLRPLQVAFETPKFMLPIRLGTVNAEGPQELFVFALTRRGRVETTNYRTVRLPTGQEIPTYVKNDFGDFYRDMFSQQVEKENMRAVFLEYAWDMAWCDPCAADPLSQSELRELGVFWLDGGPTVGPTGGPTVGPTGGRQVQPSGPQNVFVTRLHVRYDAAHFPEDLFFQQTGDRTNFQGRYVLRHAWTGNDRCPAAQEYFRQLADRREQEAKTLASLTGWNVNDIRGRMGEVPGAGSPEPAADEVPWWKRIWPG